MTITELLSRKQIPFRLARGSQELRLCCPFCTSNQETADERFRLYVNIDKGWGKCFNCNWRSRYAISSLLRHFRIAQAPTDGPKQLGLPKPPRIALPSDFTLLSKAVTDLELQARSYVLNRGITKSQLRSSRVGVSFVGKFAYRVIFPNYYKTKLRGFTARDFTGCQQPKYLHSHGVKSLYNWRDGSRVVLMEGVFKVLRVEQIKPDAQVVACLGRSLSESQLEQLKTKASEVILWPDPDGPGKRGFLTIAQVLVQHQIKTSVVWPVSKPADEASIDELAVTWKGRQPYNRSLHYRILNSIHL